jgi:hypothetical protein
MRIYNMPIVSLGAEGGSCACVLSDSSPPGRLGEHDEDNRENSHNRLSKATMRFFLRAQNDSLIYPRAPTPINSSNRNRVSTMVTKAVIYFGGTT